MQYDRMAPNMAELNALRQTQNPGEINALQQHIVETQVRTSDLAVQIGRLADQQRRLTGEERQLLEKPIADLQHENAVAVADLQMSERKLGMLMAQTTMPPPNDAFFNPPMLEKTGTAIFTLMIPIVIALARRIWVRSSPRAQPVIDLESSPRLQRLEEAIDSIAIEVERIGEAQRFATRLLSERPAPAINRAVPAQVPIARKTPGTITPH
ncbi:MAG: hypothetical protein ABIT20_13410 [Gemmatimonadaceae bacterium]